MGVAHEEFRTETYDCNARDALHVGSDARFFKESLQRINKDNQRHKVHNRDQGVYSGKCQSEEEMVRRCRDELGENRKALVMPYV